MNTLARFRLLVAALALTVVAWTSPVLADAPLVSIDGTIVSRDGDVLVVRTDKGNLMFDIDKNTEMPTNLPVNSRITIWYDSDDKPEDKMDARRIVLLPAAESPTATTPPPAPAPVAQTPPPATETPREVTTNETSDELPATANSFPLPLLAGLGALLLIGGAIALNRPGRA
jgi:hypothetical protein